LKTLSLLKFATISVFISLGVFVACSHTQESMSEGFPGKSTDSSYRKLSQTYISKKSLQFDSLFRLLHQTRGFNGSVLVSKYGQIIYKGAFGYANFINRDTLTPQTTFNIASVSKQFTSVAIMQLKEQGLLNYDDPVVKYIPNFPYDQSITIRSLLTHSSGIPNYAYALDRYYNKKGHVTNQVVADLFAAFKPRMSYQPNSHFNYNNSNYCLLAYIVEKVSGLSFREYTQKNFFEPLNMTRTFIYDPTRPDLHERAAVGYTAGRRRVYADHLDGVVGDKGVYTTVEDLYKWDMALNSEKLLKNTTLDEAFQPAHSFRNLITKNYGFGWRLKLLPNGEWFTYHTGWWHGFKAYYMHNRKDQSAVIMLSNIANGSLSNAKYVEALLYPEKAPYILGEEVGSELEVQE
jgi:CubicO group peptidase (beta-lactamase class C family)